MVDYVNYSHNFRMLRFLKHEVSKGLEDRISEIGSQRAVLFTDKQNHDRDVTTTGAAISRHDMQLPENPC
jgi:hypothetical protein